MPPQALNLLVFRETRRPVCGREPKSALQRELADFPVRPSPERVINALLRAGELECAVTDADHALAQPLFPVTDRLAEVLLQPGSLIDGPALANRLAAAVAPDEVWVSPPEGFAYYALHPLAFGDVLEKVPSLAGEVVVIGIRSIGAALSAVTAAAARKRGLRTQRITVRPAGHPYDRCTQFSLEQLELIRRSASAPSSAAFLVVDEGPGLSGSSFLSVAEALQQAGAPHEKITLICGHEPDFDSLRADDAPRRARRFRWRAVSAEPRRRPAGANVPIGGGEWRKHSLRDERAWPASWINFERLKYLSGSEPDQKLFKFLGFGHYGDQVLLREGEVAGGGFGLRPQRESDGFASYRWIAGRNSAHGNHSRLAGCGLSGRPMSAGDLSEAVLERLAEYCEFRARTFAANTADAAALEQMAEHNLSELGVDWPVALKIKRPAICDGRMQPHEWLLTKDGRMLKTDSASHGDDHFFPGPTDIAWDLAGAIVEWRMGAAERNFFLAAYRRASGEDPRFRIPDFIAAYGVFRWAYCRMAANALQGTDEQKRMEQAAADYGAALLSLAGANVS